MAHRKKKFVCPSCGKKLPSAYSRVFPATNTRVKYFKCECGRRLKSTERIVPITSPRRQAG